MNIEINMQNLQRVLNVFVSSEKKSKQPILQTLSANKQTQNNMRNSSLLKIIQAARNSEAMNQDDYD